MKKIFLQALACREDGQRRFLEDACGADSEVRQEVESLLRYHLGGPGSAAKDDETPDGGGSGA